VQGSEWQLKLGLCTCRAQDPHSSSGGDGVIEEYGLAHAGPATQNQHATTSGTRAIQQCGNRGPFEVPSVQHQISTSTQRRSSRPSLPMIVEHWPSAPSRNTRRFRRFDCSGRSIA
jgi:hypothetical protein